MKIQINFVSSFGARKAIFNIFVLLYMLAPLILIPIWACRERNAWLLVGIAVSYIASYSAAARSKLVFLFLLLCIGVWLKAGFSFHQYITFFFFCALCGYLFFQLAESTQNEYALQSLIERPDIFNRAMAEHRIMIVRKRKVGKALTRTNRARHLRILRYAHERITG